MTLVLLDSKTSAAAKVIEFPSLAAADASKAGDRDANAVENLFERAAPAERAASERQEQDQQEAETADAAAPTHALWTQADRLHRALQGELADRARGFLRPEGAGDRLRRAHCAAAGSGRYASGRR